MGRELGTAESDEERAKLIGDVMEAARSPIHVFKKDDRSTVTLIQAGSRRWVYKQIHAAGSRGWLHRFYRILKLSPAWREWRAQRRLEALGMRVAMAAAIVVDELGEESLLSPLVEGKTLHSIDPPDESPATRLRLAAILGRQAGRMLAQGWVNRDHKATNLIIDDACWAGRAEPVILDAMGVRRRRSDAQAYRMLAVLLRSTQLHRPVKSRESLIALREALRADPSLAAGQKHPLRYAEAIIRKDLALC